MGESSIVIEFDDRMAQWAVFFWIFDADSFHPHEGLEITVDGLLETTDCDSFADFRLPPGNYTVVITGEQFRLYLPTVE